MDKQVREELRQRLDAAGVDAARSDVLVVWLAEAWGRAVLAERELCAMLVDEGRFGAEAGVRSGGVPEMQIHQFRAIASAMRLASRRIRSRNGANARDELTACVQQLRDQLDIARQSERLARLALFEFTTHPDADVRARALQAIQEAWPPPRLEHG